MVDVEEAQNEEIHVVDSNMISGNEKVTTSVHEHSPPAETDEDDTPKGVINRGKNFDPPPTEIDLYGNIQLHHSVSRTNPDLSRLESLLQEHPNGAQKKNQFGRIPLHYVFDRAKPSLPAAKMLVKAYPEGVSVEDNDGNTPYDIALDWNHSKRLLRLLLSVDKYQDIETWRRIEYGYLYNVCFCCCMCGNGGTSNSDGDDTNLIERSDER